METAKPIVERFPTGFLLFIVTSGLFLVISFPFDFLGGMVDLNFNPFIHLSHLHNNFSIGIAMILLSSLVIGVFFYLSYDFFVKINHGARVFLEVLWNLIIYRRFSVRGEGDRDTKEKKSLSTRWREGIEFNEWAISKKIAKQVDFMWSMRMMVAALLYSSQVFTVVNLGCVFLVVLGAVQLYVWFVWTSGALGLSAVFYVFLTYYRSKHNEHMKALTELFKTDRAGGREGRGS